MESEHILFEIPCGLCYFTQFEHKLGTLLLGEWMGLSFKPSTRSTRQHKSIRGYRKPNLIGGYRSVVFF